mgnify:CR=1 FL=1
MLKLFIDILLFIIIAYYCYRFFQVLFRLNHHVLFPLTEQDLNEVRPQPESKLDYPNFSNHKFHILIHGGVYAFVIAVYFWGLSLSEINLSLYLTLLLPATSAKDVYSLFAFVEEGVISGFRFVPWGRITSFEYVPIDINHRFYGYAKEVNNSYELKMKTKFGSVSCVVLTEEMREKLTAILTERIPGAEKEKAALHRSEI